MMDVYENLNKTLDRFNWDFVLSALQKSGNADKFIHMIKVAFIKFQSKIKIITLLSDPFILMQGFCQGRPLLMLLYIIAV